MPAFRGSCLCGEVAFEVEGPFDRFLNCHCSRCRKATGTAHSCEVIVQASALRWLRGEASVTRFDLPTAKSFATAFCKICGSPMPHLTRSGREAIIHAGAFDEPLGAAPDRHAQWSSRADWYVHGEGLGRGTIATGKRRDGSNSHNRKNGAPFRIKQRTHM